MALKKSGSSLFQTLKKYLDIFSFLPFLKSKTADEYYNRAIDLYQNKEYQKAISFLSKAEAKAHDPTAALYTKGLCYQELGDTQKAKEAYQKVLTIIPEDTDTLYNLSRLYYNEEDLDTALAYAEQAIDMIEDNGDEMIYYLLALIYEQQNRVEDAIRYYEQTIDLDPAHIEAGGFLSKLYIKQQDYPKAISILKNMVEYNPDNLQFNYELALCLAKIGEWEDTVKYCRRVIEIDPAFVKAYNQLGLALYCMERLNEAVESYKKALEIDPKYATALNNLAYTYEKLQDYSNAIEKFSEFLTLKGYEESSAERMELEEHIALLKRKILTSG